MKGRGKYRPVSVKEFYNTIHHQYYDPSAHKVSCRVKEIHETILRKLRTSVTGKVLDVGCASQEAPINTVGCDLSIEGLILRRKLYPDSSSVCADINCLPFKEGTFSAILAGLLLDHLEDLELAFSSLGSVVAPKGRLVVTVFDSERRPKKKYGGDRLQYSTTDGEIYSVPSFAWGKEDLILSAAKRGWTASDSHIHDTSNPDYRLLQLNFSCAGD